MSKKHWLKKYMKLENLERTLKEKQLHLGNPTVDWDDKNDSECIRIYSAKKSQGFEILGTCLTEAADRFHFWHIFGDKEKGVCLWFEKESLIKDIMTDGSLVANKVEYRRAEQLSKLKADLLPFVKREQYRDECEFRVLRVRAAQKLPTDKFSFSANSLKRIYLNSWLDYL